MIDTKAIRELCESAKVENDYTEPVYGSDTYQLIVNKIPALLDELEAAQNAHRWIPVTERLPEKDTAVLCFTALGQKTGWVGASGGFNFTYGKGVVTHWMPLPEPPKGDSHE